MVFLLLETNLFITFYVICLASSRSHPIHSTLLSMILTYTESISLVNLSDNQLKIFNFAIVKGKIMMM